MLKQIIFVLDTILHLYLCHKTIICRQTGSHMPIPPIICTFEPLTALIHECFSSKAPECCFFLSCLLELCRRLHLHSFHLFSSSLFISGVFRRLAAASPLCPDILTLLTAGWHGAPCCLVVCKCQSCFVPQGLCRDQRAKIQSCEPQKRENVTRGLPGAHCVPG